MTDQSASNPLAPLDRGRPPGQPNVAKVAPWPHLPPLGPPPRPNLAAANAYRGTKQNADNIISASASRTNVDSPEGNQGQSPNVDNPPPYRDASPNVDKSTPSAALPNVDKTPGRDASANTEQVSNVDKMGSSPWPKISDVMEAGSRSPIGAGPPPGFSGARLERELHMGKPDGRIWHQTDRDENPPQSEDGSQGQSVEPPRYDLRSRSNEGVVLHEPPEAAAGATDGNDEEPQFSVRHQEEVTRILQGQPYVAPSHLGSVSSPQKTPPSPAVRDSFGQDGSAQPRVSGPPIAVQSRNLPGRTPAPSEEAIELLRRTSRQQVADFGERAQVTPGFGSRPSTALRNGGTISRKTLDMYHIRGQNLLKRYRREMQLGIEVEVSPIHFANWALSLKAELRPSSWRLYRQAVLHLLPAFPLYETAEAIGMIETDILNGSEVEDPAERETSRRRSARQHQNNKAPGEDADWLMHHDATSRGEDYGAPISRRGVASYEGLPTRTSRLKEKRFPKADLERVITYLRLYSRAEHAPALADWLNAGILTALRPAEWKCTDLIEIPDPVMAYGRRVYLHVLNAKATNGRGTGVVRTLDLSAFPDEHLATIKRMSSLGRSWLAKGEFEQKQSVCRGLLREACGKLWPLRKYHYALYSPRHQAIANWKAAITPPEIAAMVGHIITSTAETNYAKRRSAWAPSETPPPPRPVPEELSLVRDRIRLWEERFTQRKALGLLERKTSSEYPIGG